MLKLPTHSGFHDLFLNWKKYRYLANTINFIDNAAILKGKTFIKILHADALLNTTIHLAVWLLINVRDIEGQSRMENTEKQVTLGTQDTRWRQTNKNHNTICVGTPLCTNKLYIINKILREIKFIYTWCYFTSYICWIITPSNISIPMQTSSTLFLISNPVTAVYEFCTIIRVRQKSINYGAAIWNNMTVII